MGARRYRRNVMAWETDLSNMKAAGTRVRRICTSPCAFYEDVDLDAMIALLRGGDMTVWDTRPPCELCGKLTHYMASPSAGTLMRPLLSSKGPLDPDDLPADAWMAGWTGIH